MTFAGLILLLALQAKPAPESMAGRPKVTTSSTFSHTYENGTKVELYAVTTSGWKHAWRPNGEPIAKLKWKSAQVIGGNPTPNNLVMLRVSFPGNPPWDYPYAGSEYSDILDQNETGQEWLYVCAFDPPSGKSKMNMVFYVSVDPFKRIAYWKVRDGKILDGNSEAPTLDSTSGGDSDFAKKHPTTGIKIPMRKPLSQEWWVVVKTANGKRAPAPGMIDYLSGDFAVRAFCALKSIESIEIRSRPISALIFTHVSIEPKSRHPRKR